MMFAMVQVQFNSFSMSIYLGVKYFKLFFTRIISLYIKNVLKDSLKSVLQA